MRSVICSKCHGSLRFLKREKIQLGQTGFFSGDWGNILAGALEVEIYCCPKCGKIEFYRPEEYTERETEEGPFEVDAPEIGQNIVCVSKDGVPQVRCRYCGKTHDFDYHHCPYCDHPNN